MGTRAESERQIAPKESCVSDRDETYKNNKIKNTFRELGKRVSLPQTLKKKYNLVWL
jgi:hypothetical protein